MAHPSGQGSERAPLTRDRVLEAALALADAGGVEAVSMRRLARALGVEAMSLYYHAANRAAILDGMVDLVVRQIELPSEQGDWKSAVRASAISAHRVLRAHPWACDLLMSAPRLVPSRLRMVDALVARLGDAGLPGELADLGYHALDAHILGFTLWEAGYARGIREVTTDLDTFVQGLGLEAYPHLLEHLAFHARPRSDANLSAFEFGLDLILDGIERAGPAQVRAAARCR